MEKIEKYAIPLIICGALAAFLLLKQVGAVPGPPTRKVEVSEVVVE